MKTILDIIDRAPKPTPWSEGDNIPWNEPDFSERMLAEVQSFPSLSGKTTSDETELPVIVASR